MRKLIRYDGVEVELPSKVTNAQIAEMIGANTLDSFSLLDGVHVVVVDDTGAEDGKPINPKATELYWEKCGGQNKWTIRGDVVVAPDIDFARDEL